MENIIGKQAVFFTVDETNNINYNKKIVTITKEIKTCAGSLWQVKAKNGYEFITDLSCLYKFKIK